MRVYKISYGLKLWKKAFKKQKGQKTIERKRVRSTDSRVRSNNSRYFFLSARVLFEYEKSKDEALTP